MKKIILAIVFISAIQFTFSQNSEIQNIYVGKVYDVINNKPLNNATVIFKLANIFTITDSAGTFSVALPLNDNENPIISYVGYEIIDISATGDGMHRFLMQPKNTIFQTVTIIASRADYNTPVTYTNIDGNELNKNNFGQDMPYLLQLTPGVVVTSDAGNGVGYTYIKIRGSDASRVNITINGVPYNDSESGQTYWVDLPDFAGSVDDVQIQRGVGTSAYGISSLGGSVNINTNNLSEEPFGKINLSAGSFNLNKQSASFGTGKLNGHWYIEGKISRIYSDGYIDRAYSDLNSFFISTAYKSEKYTSILNIFSGKEKTYQAWGGVPKDSLQTNRTYNPFTYPNQTDNYTQTHYQWHNTFEFNDASTLKLTLNYTHGKGYYEEYETEQLFSDYGLTPVIISTDTFNYSDLITQKWLDNNFGGAYLQYQKKLSDDFNITAGSAYYYYFGKHSGKIIWSQYAFPNSYAYEWYSDNATKKDGNIFTQINYSATERLNLYLDVQVRNVSYNFTGLDKNANDVAEKVNTTFFNPKFGVSFTGSSNSLFYLSFAKSGKEPNRDDYVSSSPASRPQPEILYDMEAGEKLKIKGWQLQAGVYYMYYINQLVLNGEINDVGEYTRINIPKSYRTGIEIAWSKLFFNKLSWNANISFSKNVIPAYIEYVDNWDAGTQQIFTYRNTQIAFSPPVVAASDLNYILKEYQTGEAKNYNLNSFALQLTSKYVSRQYIDNTENDFRSLGAYFLNDISLNYTSANNLLQNLTLRFIVQNVFNVQYESNAWVYRYIYENAEQQLSGYFPQAGRNYVISLNIEF